MKLQIIKEWGLTSPEFFYKLYENGKFITTYLTIEDAEAGLEKYIAIKSQNHKPEIIKEVQI